MGEREGEHSGNYVSSAPTLGGLMICLMFLTIMCLATQKNILCKLLKLYHQQQHEQSGREQGGRGGGGVQSLASNKPQLGPASLDSFAAAAPVAIVPQALLAFKCKWRRLCLPWPPPPSCDLPPSCRRLVVLSTCEQLSGGYQFGPFVARLQPKVAWLIYVLLACFLCCLPLLSHLSLFVFLGFLLRE